MPTNPKVCAYLKSLGLFQILIDQGVELDDHDILAEQDAHPVLPLTRFNDESEVEQLTNQAYDALQIAGLGSANLYPVVSETFAEFEVVRVL